METETDLLADLIAQKRECLLELRQMGRLQMELVRQGEMTRLLDLLSVKQGALGRLQRVERRLDPFRDEAPDRRRWRTPEARQQCARQLAECEAVLGEIVSQERDSERELARRRDEVAVRLQGVHTASEARGAYSAPTSRTGQIDLASEK